MLFSILGLNWGQNEMSNLTITKDAEKDQKFDEPAWWQCLFYVLHFIVKLNKSCSSLELTFLESENQQLSISIVNKWITRIVFISKLVYYIQFWPVNMTGKSIVCPVKALIGPDIVRWPAIIFSPDLCTDSINVVGPRHSLVYNHSQVLKRVKPFNNSGIYFKKKNQP